MRIRKRYRVTIDVDVDLDDITMDEARARVVRRNAALLREPGGIAGLLSVPAEADLTAQRALRDEIARRPEVLDRWLRREVLLTLLHDLDESDVAPESERSILPPVIEDLPPRFRHWWRQTFYSGDDDLVERSEDFYGCLHAEFGAITLQEVERPET